MAIENTYLPHQKVLLLAEKFKWNIQTFEYIVKLL